MQSHRFRDLVEGGSEQQSAPAGPPSSGFMACPILMAQAMLGGQPGWQLAIYQLAFEQAKAAQKPSQSLRDLMPSLN
jgi:hypothetical protein